ncbi:MAG: VanW family protein [Firmicutes bacterium]|nr:VanW family protein [Bacillota bacterium]
MMKQEKKQLPRWTIIAIIVVILLLLGTFIDYVYHRQRIYAGVYIDEMDVGGKTKIEALQLMEEQLAEANFSQNTVEFVFADISHRKTFTDLGITADLANTIEAAFATGRNGMHLFRYGERLRLKRSQENILPLVQIDQTQFEKSLHETFIALQREPVNATLTLSADRKKVEIKPDVPGHVLDMLATYQEVQESMESFFTPLTIELPIHEVEAEITVASVAELQITEEIATFSTIFSSENANRVHNIRLAATALDKSLILADQVFSYNETVGDTTAANGYRAAPIIMNGELVDGIGGGICQVSSTLYNAALLANLDIVERRNHGLRVSYLPPGLDATVSYGGIDLKFANNRDHALWLRIFIDGNKITTTLYGTKMPGLAVKVYTTDVEIIPPSEKIIETAELPKGKRELIKEGLPGYRATVWRTTTQNGLDERTEKISQDTYKATPAEYRVGTAELPVSGESEVEESDVEENGSN